MFNLLPKEMCQVCFHTHTPGGSQCLQEDWAPGPDGDDIMLGLCYCAQNADAEYVKHLYIVPCDVPEHKKDGHMHSRYIK